MRHILFAALFGGSIVVACTKPNPELAGECTASSSCTAAAPYCPMDGDRMCAATCTVDTECPGFSQAATDTFCVGGACVACKTGMGDCPSGAPCTANEQCESGACSTAGTCADETQVAYVATTGTPTGPCTKANPCSSVTYAIAQNPAQYIVIASGIYAAQNVLSIAGPRALIGSGSPSPQLTNDKLANVIEIAGGVVSLDNLDISGAAPNPDIALSGNGVYCNNVNAGIQISRSSIHDNGLSGLLTQCAATVVTSSFTRNDTGIAIFGATEIDRCDISGNQEGIGMVNGTISLTNSFVTRNTDVKSGGVDLDFALPGSVVAFNTIADNAEFGVDCEMGTVDVSNNIIARNGANTAGSGSCTFASSMIVTDVTALHFKSPDTAPYDYHLLHGSSAIDAATTSTIDHDFDGDHRPMGSASDVGADEAE